MQHVDVKIHGPVATILLDRTRVRNALSPQLLENLQQALSDLHQERRVRVVVLTGAGNHFCSGLDLRILAQITDLPPDEATVEWLKNWRRLTETYEQMLRFPKPIIAAVDGAAVGAGFGLALASDVIVASRRARFSVPAAHHGLVGGATAALLSFRMGGSVAARLLLSGDALSAAQAHRLGLCDPPVAAEQIWVAATELGRRCAEASGEAIQATKRVLNESIGESLMTQLAAGAADSATACTTEAAAEGIVAFLESRPPHWP